MFRDEYIHGKIIKKEGTITMKVRIVVPSKRKGGGGVPGMPAQSDNYTRVHILLFIDP